MTIDPKRLLMATALAVVTASWASAASAQTAPVYVNGAAPGYATSELAKCAIVPGSPPMIHARYYEVQYDPVTSLAVVPHTVYIHVLTFPSGVAYSGTAYPGTQESIDTWTAASNDFYNNLIGKIASIPTDFTQLVQGLPPADTACTITPIGTFSYGSTIFPTSTGTTSTFTGSGSVGTAPSP